MALRWEAATPHPGTTLRRYFFFAFFLVAFFFIEGFTSFHGGVVDACSLGTRYFFFFLAAFFFATGELTSFPSPALPSGQKPMASRRRCCAWSAPRGSYRARST
jgi:hypothetical protein